MNTILRKLTVLLLFSAMINSALPFDCNLPKGCFVQSLKYRINEYSYEKSLFEDGVQGIKCKPEKGFQFRFDENDFMRTFSRSNRCYITKNKNEIYESLIFEWPKNNELIILDESFDVPNMISYLGFFYWFFEITLTNLRGFDINLSSNNGSIIENDPSISTIICAACTMNFYTNGKLIKSCSDILESNSTIMSIFQLRVNYLKHVAIDNSEYPTDICPLVFKNSDIYILFLMGLIDSFYKKSTLKFTDDVFDDLNSTISILQLDKVENINLDLNLLNPSVFSKLQEIYIYGPIVIDKNLFASLPNLSSINLRSVYFRKLVHENGIDWINEINKEKESVDIRNVSEIYRNSYMIRYIAILYTSYAHEAPLFEVFPDEDFCVYKDFPFDRLVILMQYFDYNKELIELSNTDEFTCTYLWLTQYFDYYYEYFWTNSTTSKNIKKIIESRRFRERSKCNFEHRLDLCYKTNFKINDIWSTIDNYFLNKKLQSVFKITSYLVSLFGIVTNLLTIIIIVIKSNNDLFKEFKQYTYLCINSTFCLMILIINILSWTSECFYPFEAFCPEIRRFAFFQFFKIIFKECLTTAFRFMLNFTYVAFSLNRIVVIKKDQNKFILYISDVSIKKYIRVCLFISAGLSVIKYFKYEVNYDYPLMNYPISNEWDIFSVNERNSHTFDDSYFIMNSISDIVNYILFVLICVFIDIYMIHELRKSMTEKLQNAERLYEQVKTKVESVKKENEDAINKVIRMVIINTAIGLLFKMPISFIPILNVYAAFYYKSFEMRYTHPAFDRFYSFLFNNGFYGQISDLADLLFIISISIQPLIYKRFDKKIKTAFDRLIHKKVQQPFTKPISTK